MTKREAERQWRQENSLLDLGFTREEAAQLRRISMTLHRWYEQECGTDSYAIVRGTWNQDAQTFEYDTGPHGGAPHYEWANGSGRRRYTRIADRETGAVRRLSAIIEARNKRAVAESMPHRGLPGQPDQDETARLILSAYLQTDPRGAVLYIIRPGDVPEGKDVQGWYTRGVCVY